MAAATAGPRPGPSSRATGTRAISDLRPAHACGVARLVGVRRRARLRGRDARSRPALRARQQLGAETVPQARGDAGDLDGPGRGRHEALRQGHGALHPPDVLGRARRHAAGVSADPESTRWCLCLYETAMPPAGRHLDHALAVPPADHRMHAGRRQGRLPLSEQRARADRGEVARLRQLHPAATCSATSPSSAPRTSSSPRTAWSTRRPRTARSSTASRASAPSSCCATPA